jgi:hypothetical protein
VNDDAYGKQVRDQLADTRVRTAYLESVVRYLTEESNRDEASRDRFWRAWQSTIVEARKQHARADRAEAELAAVEKRAAFWQNVVRATTDQMARAVSAWQSTIVEARRQHARAGTAEARIAAVRALAIRLAALDSPAGVAGPDPALVAAEDALTRVMRLAEQLPADMRERITAAIDGPAGSSS